MANRAIPLEDSPEMHRRTRHAVFSVIWRPEPGSLTCPQLCTAFVLDVLGRWILITADHSVDDVLKRSESGTLWISKNGDPFGQPICFRCSDENTVRLKQCAADALSTGTFQGQQLGDLLQHLSQLDIAAVWLEDLYTASLKSAGVQPFGKDEVLDLFTETLKDADCEILVCGFPAKSVELEGRGHSQELHLLPIKLIGQDGDRFVFEPNWPKDLRPGDVSGMSGGPIVAVCSDKLRVIGVQSSQFGVEGKTPRKLYVAPIFWVFRALEEIETQRASPTEN